MADRAVTDRLFFDVTRLDKAVAMRAVHDALRRADDGELFLEHRRFESLILGDGRIRSASFSGVQGFGLRAVVGDVVGYAHSSTLDNAAVRRAVEMVKATPNLGRGGECTVGPPAKTDTLLYADHDPTSAVPFDEKVALLSTIDAYVRAKDPRVRQVIASLRFSWQAVGILRLDGEVADIRPMAVLNVVVVVEQGGRREKGACGQGGRMSLDGVFVGDQWRNVVDQALRQALVNLDSVSVPAGEWPVVLGPGWPGVLLHEAVGHGLEGDFNRKKTSVFSRRMGQRVAAPGVTVVDDGTMAERRGSLNMDDEGSPTQRNVLIEDGILTGYMFDRMNARLMGTRSTGNGRRQSYAHQLMPRMTNTFMLGGQMPPADIIKSVKRGVYATDFGGGQVDITSGKFVFECTEAYLIENGELTAPLKNATLIGDGAEVLTRVSMIGDDFALDKGTGTCGKNGQSVPTCVGQPTLKIDRLTVGGGTVR